MPASVRSSLQFLVVRHAGDADFGVLPRRLQDTLQGQTMSASADIMGGILVRDLSSPGAIANHDQLLGAALHTVAVVLAGMGGASDADWVAAVEALVQVLDATPARFSTILIFSSLDAANEAPVLNAFQHQTLDQIGEKHVWPQKLIALALQRGRTLLAGALYPGKADYPHRRFFISHAKEDGVFLARAVCAAAEEMPELQNSCFYDARNIASGARWDANLRHEARHSTFIALRTDRYCERAWCMREIIEAEDARAPVLIVDARTALASDPAWPPLDSAYSIRIPHGNLAQVVISALLTHLIYLSLRRSVEEFCAAAGLPQPITLPRPPNLISLASCVREAQNFPADQNLRIVYPGAEMEKEGQAAAEILLGPLAKTARLLSFQSLSVSSLA
jgi:TIR domain